ncbi:MAG: hypothetical protein MI867_19620, partial [Pseudomonadales bacterium]|nr:hypothetical protein [Pseudomonadales bacterium]
FFQTAFSESLVYASNKANAIDSLNSAIARSEARPNGNGLTNNPDSILNDPTLQASLNGWDLGPNQTYDFITKEEYDSIVASNGGDIPAGWVGESNYRTGASNLVDAEGSILNVINGFEKPGELLRWAQKDFRENPFSYSHQLTDRESAYLSHFGIVTLAPDTLSSEQIAKANSIFADGVYELSDVANFYNRSRVVNHFVMSHPATQEMFGFAYRFARDINPVHFAFERGYQVGSGEEFATGVEVNKIRSGVEFIAALTIPIVADKLIGRWVNGAPATTSNLKVPALYPKEPYHLRVQNELRVHITRLDGSEVSLPVQLGAVNRGVRIPDGMSAEEFVNSIVKNGGFKQTGTNFDIVNQVRQGPNSGLVGATPSEDVAARFALTDKYGNQFEQGIVITTKNVPSYDTRQAYELAGRRIPVDGEIEYSIHSGLPLEYIDKIQVVRNAGVLKDGLTPKVRFGDVLYRSGQ